MPVSPPSGLSSSRRSTAASAAPFGERRWALLYLLAAAAVLVAAYPPLSGGCYGFVDDYVLLDGRRPFPDWPFLSWVARDGRPLYGVLLNLVMLPLRDVCDLGFLRLLNIVLEALIATQVFMLARRHDWPLPTAAALGLLLAALPGFALAAAWPTLVGPLAAMSLGLAAAWLAVPPPGRRAAVGRLAGAACLLAIALALYQPGAMAFVTGVAIALIRRPASMATIREALFPAGLVFVAVIAAYASLYLALPVAIPGEAISVRAELAPDPWAKLVWFLGVPLRQAMNIFNLQPVPRFGFAVMALVAAGTLLRQRDVGLGILSLGIQAGLVVLAFLPNLVVAESWPAFRSGLPMSMTIAVLTAAGVSALAERLAARSAVPLGAFLVAAGATYGFAATMDAAEHGLIRLQREEWRIVTEAMRQQRPATGAPTIFLVPAETLRECSYWRRFDEFGLPSTARPWAARAMLRHAWREVHCDAAPPRFVIAGREAPLPSAGAAVIDMPAALSARAEAICGR